MRRFESSRPSQAFSRFADAPTTREKRLEIARFCGFASVSVYRFSSSRARSCRKSPASSVDIPVLRRLAAETCFEATAIRAHLYWRVLLTLLEELGFRNMLRKTKRELPATGCAGMAQVAYATRADALVSVTREALDSASHVGQSTRSGTTAQTGFSGRSGVM